MSAPNVTREGLTLTSPTDTWCVIAFRKNGTASGSQLDEPTLNVLELARSYGGEYYALRLSTALPDGTELFTPMYYIDAIRTCWLEELPQATSGLSRREARALTQAARRLDSPYLVLCRDGVWRPCDPASKMISVTEPTTRD
jgi:hypothetical protein